MPQPQDLSSDRKVYLKNLPNGVDKEAVVDLLQRVGRPIRVHVFPSKDGVTTVAVATMESREAALRAFQLPRPGGVIIERARPKGQVAPRPGGPPQGPAREGYAGPPMQGRAPVSPRRMPQGMYAPGGAQQGRAARAPDRAPPARAPVHQNDEPPVGAEPMLSNTMSDMDRQLYLMHVPMEWTETDVKRFLSCGESMHVRRVWFPNSPVPGKVARAEMITAEAARSAIERLNGRRVGADGLRIAIEYQTVTKVDPVLRNMIDAFGGQYPRHLIEKSIRVAERHGCSGKEVPVYAGNWLLRQAQR